MGINFLIQDLDYLIEKEAIKQKGNWLDKLTPLQSKKVKKYKQKLWEESKTLDKALKMFKKLS